MTWRMKKVEDDPRACHCLYDFGGVLTNGYHQSYAYRDATRCLVHKDKDGERIDVTSFLQHIDIFKHHIDLAARQLDLRNMEKGK